MIKNWQDINLINSVQILLLVILFCVSQARAQNPEENEVILKKSGCLVCHAIDQTRVGPAYKDVAARYKAPDATTKSYLGSMTAFDYLMKKVRMGTKVGLNKNWIKSKEGRAYGMMLPNPEAKISDDELKKILNYILSL